MAFFEYTNVNVLVSLINGLHNDPSRMWGVATIKREYLRPITNEAFSLAMHSEIRDADDVHIFFLDATRIDVVWCGKQKSVFRQLVIFLETSLLHSGTMSGASAVTYINPRANHESYLLDLDAERRGIKSRAADLMADFPDAQDDEPNENEEPSTAFDPSVSSAQSEAYLDTAAQKIYRTNLHILVVEDQAFSQRLICEVLRGARIRNSKENPVIDAVQGIQEAWKIFLKKAPDLVFIDLCLIDGSGHMLAAAIKCFDPTAQVIIVTANNYQEELSVARQNNVDGFIVKPYNKKQILDCVDRYINTTRPVTLGKSYH